MLISQEENARLERLTLERAADPDVRWLCELVQRLAALKPTEEGFPDKLVLLNHHANNAYYPMKFAERVHFQERELVQVGHLAIALEHQLSCQLSDAFLFTRPYVRLVSPKNQDTLDRLVRLGRVTVDVDHVRLFDGPLADVLVGFDGYGIHRRPLYLRPVKDCPCFEVGTFLPDPDRAVRSDLGVFLPHGSVIVVTIGYPMGLGDEIRISTGLVLGRYTTQGVSCQTLPYPVEA